MQFFTYYVRTRTHAHGIEAQMETQTCERGTGNLMAKILTFVCEDERVEFLFICGKILNNYQISFPSKLKKVTPMVVIIIIDIQTCGRVIT